MAKCRTHELRIQRTYADAIVNGDKTFEIRDNSDYGFQCGDIIHFSAISPIGEEKPHAIDNQEYMITYVQPYYGLMEDFVALAIKRTK